MPGLNDKKHLIKRGSGILLHATSLPSPFGVGDFGPAARHFVDFLEETKQTYWQILPLTPADDINGNSPYHSDSAFAFNRIFISPEVLSQKGLISKEALDDLPRFQAGPINYPSVYSLKNNVIKELFNVKHQFLENEELEQFKLENSHWLEDYCLYCSLKSHFKGKAWFEWPNDLRDRDPDSVRIAKEQFDEELKKTALIQYLLYRQWMSLKGYANGRGIRIIGDIPIYVVHDSADVWVNREIFNLDENRMPLTVAGVPPDYFSETGQLWGNPVYRWEVLKERGYDWWIERIKHSIKLYDFIRIDHFRGFAAYWEIPFEEKNAVNGHWVQGPGKDFFLKLAEVIPYLPIIAEDLGVITPDVIDLINRLGFPGMKILLFAFGDNPADNPYAPHNLTRNCLVYTGTHDNNTAKAWYIKEATDRVKENLRGYIGKNLTQDNISRELIRLAMMSVADLSIFPLQDILNLEEDSRMNTPGVKNGNWEWRLDERLITQELRDNLRSMTEIYGRAGK